MAKKKLSVAILGSRGIPNRYGGFEALAEELAVRLAALNYHVLVYTSGDHPVKSKLWNGVQRVLVPDPEKKLGTFGQFIYDLNSNRRSQAEDLDIVLHLGYTSDSVWYRLWKKNCIHIVNMDGQEWKRSKYNRFVRAYLRLAERLATRRSHFLVADSPEIEKYLLEKYTVPVRYIAYGAEIPATFHLNVLKEWGLVAGRYDLVVARMEPENNIEMAIRAKLGSGDQIPLLIFGNDNKYRRKLQKIFAGKDIIRFCDGVYDRTKLDSIRHFSRLYLHGHSVGGTNPSLLEAMACSCRIVAHDNPFNRYVLSGEAVFYPSVKELTRIFLEYENLDFRPMMNDNLDRIRKVYNWERVTALYDKLFSDATGL